MQTLALNLTLSLTLVEVLSNTCMLIEAAKQGNLKTCTLNNRQVPIKIRYNHMIEDAVDQFGAETCGRNSYQLWRSTLILAITMIFPWPSYKPN